MTPKYFFCAGKADTLTLTVDTLVAPNFDPIAAICSGDALTPLPTISKNGITGSWSPALNNTDTTEYTFAPDPNQCASEQKLTINVNSIDDASFNYSNYFLCGSDPAEVPKSVDSSGTFKVFISGLKLNTSTWEINPGLSESKLYTIFYTTKGLCPSTVGKGIQIRNPKVDPSLDQTICAGSDVNAITFTGNT